MTSLDNVDDDNHTDGKHGCTPEMPACPEGPNDIGIDPSPEQGRMKWRPTGERVTVDSYYERNTRNENENGSDTVDCGVSVHRLWMETVGHERPPVGSGSCGNARWIVFTARQKIVVLTPRWGRTDCLFMHTSSDHGTIVSAEVTAVLMHLYCRFDGCDSGTIVGKRCACPVVVVTHMFALDSI